MDSCQICEQSREAHNSPDIHHVFSVDGRLLAKPPKKRPGASSTEEGQVVLRLISLLRAKGLLSTEDLGILFPAPAVPSDSHPE